MPELNRLDDPDYPAYTIGQAADLLGVQHAFLRSLDTAEVVSPHRSGGGHRRYSRRQLETVVRLRALFDKGHTLSAAARILGLENELAATQDQLSAAEDDLAATRDDLAAARDEITDLRAQLAHTTDKTDEHRPQPDTAADVVERNARVRPRRRSH